MSNVVLIYFLYDVLQPNNRSYTVGDFMTRKEDLRVVKPTTTVDEGTCYTDSFCVIVE